MQTPHETEIPGCPKLSWKKQRGKLWHLDSWPAFGQEFPGKGRSFLPRDGSTCQLLADLATPTLECNGEQELEVGETPSSSVLKWEPGVWAACHRIHDICFSPNITWVPSRNWFVLFFWRHIQQQQQQKPSSVPVVAVRGPPAVLRTALCKAYGIHSILADATVISGLLLVIKGADGIGQFQGHLLLPIIYHHSLSAFLFWVMIALWTHKINHHLRPARCLTSRNHPAVPKEWLRPDHSLWFHLKRPQRHMGTLEGWMLWRYKEPALLLVRVKGGSLR